MDDKTIRKILRKTPPDREWYSLRSLLGYSWAIFYLILGARETGKSYAVMNFFLRQWKTKKVPFTWLRLSETSQKAMLNNKAAKFVDPDLVRKYDLDLTVKGSTVYDHGEKMAEVLAVSTFAKQKGVALFDSDYTDWYNICLDEFMRDQGERNTFDINYCLVNELENLVRSRKEKLRIFMIANTLEEASDVLCMFNFVPEEFGRFKLKKQRAIIEYLPQTEKYMTRRKGTVADLLAPNASTFTNKVENDTSLVYKGAIYKPSYVLAFSKNKDDWFTLWDDKVIKRYNGEKVDVIPMRPYLDMVFNPVRRDNVLLLFDNRFFYYRDLITFKLFQKNLKDIKPRK